MIPVQKLLSSTICKFYLISCEYVVLSSLDSSMHTKTVELKGNYAEQMPTWLPPVLKEGHAGSESDC